MWKSWKKSLGVFQVSIERPRDIMEADSILIAFKLQVFSAQKVSRNSIENQTQMVQAEKLFLKSSPIENHENN